MVAAVTLSAIAFVLCDCGRSDGWHLAKCQGLRAAVLAYKVDKFDG